MRKWTRAPSAMLTLALAMSAGCTVTPEHLRAPHAFTQKLVHRLPDTAAGSERVVESVLQTESVAAVTSMPSGQSAYEQARVWLKQGDTLRALHALNQCLNIEPNHVEALNARASIYATQGKWADANRDLGAALSLDESRAHVHYNLGVLKHMQRDDVAAKTAFQRALVLDPGHERSRQALSALTAVVGRPSVNETPQNASNGHMSLVRVPNLQLSTNDGSAFSSDSGVPVAIGAQLVVPDSVAMAARLDRDARVAVVNTRGASTLARSLTLQWRDQGVRVTRILNLGKMDLRQTRVYFRPGFERAAQQIALGLPVQAQLLPARSNHKRDVLVVIGHDLRGYRLTESGWVDDPALAMVDEKLADPAG